MTTVEDIGPPSTDRHGFNLLDPSTFSDGHPWSAYAAMRRSGRLLRHPGGGDSAPFWVLTHHEDIRAVSHDTARFSSADGFNMPSEGRRTDPEVLKAIGRNILNYDPPGHGAFKSILMPAFSAAKLKVLEERTRVFTDELLDSLEGRSEVEFVREVAAVIPIRLICALLGIPREDEPRILDWTNRMVGGDDADFVPDPMVAFQAFMEVFAYGRRMVEQRLAEPGDDLMTLVAQARLDGAALDTATRDGMCATLIAAGNETTRNAITGTFMLLSSHPDQRDRLIAHPELIDNAVEEVLRCITPVIQMARTAKYDLDLCGQTVRAGEQVALLYGAANRDPAVFDDPDAFNIARPNARRHLAFGTGIHLCIGQRLAQMEMRVMIPALLRRYPNLEMLGAGRYMRSNFVSGVKSIQARLN